MYTLCFDGLFRKADGADSIHHAGFMGYGWLISRQHIVIARGHGVVARGAQANSSVAEYLALIEGLEALYDLGIRHEAVEIRGDARFVIEQMSNQAAVNSPSLKPLYKRASQLAGRFSQLQWVWMPRKSNRQADALSRRAMQQIDLDLPGYQAALETIQADDPIRSARRFLPLVDLRVYQGTA